MTTKNKVFVHYYLIFSTVNFTRSEFANDTPDNRALLEKFMRDMVVAVGMTELAPPRCTFSTGINNAFTVEIALVEPPSSKAQVDVTLNESNAVAHIYPFPQIELAVMTCKKPSAEEIQCAEELFTTFWQVEGGWFDYFANDPTQEEWPLRERRPLQILKSNS